MEYTSFFILKIGVKLANVQFVRLTARLQNGTDRFAVKMTTNYIVKNVLDTNGDLATVKSKMVSASPYVNYASNFTYNAAGAVTSMELGNLNWESTEFNSRLQPKKIALGKTVVTCSPKITPGGKQESK